MKHAREDYNRFQDPEGLIPQDEPVFLLRGQDEFAPGLLRLYADRCTYRKLYDMATLVYKWADEMEKWQQEIKVKLPDLKS